MKSIIVILLFFFGLSFNVPRLSTQDLNIQMPNTISKSEKVYGLSKFWQEVNYNFVYLNKVDPDKWESDYKQLISDVQETKDDYEYYRLLQRFCASLKDGHTNVNFPSDIQQRLFNTYFGEYRLFLEHIDNKAIVTRTNLSKKNELPVGTEVVKVNGMDMKLYLEQEVIPYISSSTDYILMDWAVSRMFQAPEGTSFDVTFKLPNGEHKELKLTHTTTIEEEVYPANDTWKLFEFKWIEEEIAYVALNSFGYEAIDSHFTAVLPELYKAKKLIVDLRKNGGGNTNIGLNILRYFTHDTLLYGSSNQSRLHIPSFKAWGRWAEEKDTIGNEWATQAYLSYHDNFFHDFPYEADTITLSAKRLVVPTVILIGHNTASAAEDFLIYTDNQNHMIKMGEPTFGSTGQPLMFDMPGGGSARVCTKKDTYPDGREFVGYGILPDVTVKKTLEDYLENKDALLDRAVQQLNEN